MAGAPHVDPFNREAFPGGGQVRPVSRRVVLAAALAAVVASGLIFADALQTGVRRVLFLTRADPGTLGLVASVSAEPVDLSLVAQPVATGERTGGRAGSPTAPTLAIRVPAAFVSVIDLKDGAAGGQRLGFSVWRRGFQPFQPDLLAFRTRRQAKGFSPDAAISDAEDDPYLERLRAGDDELRFEVGNRVAPDAAERDRILLKLTRADARGADGEPCAVETEERAGLLVIRPTAVPSARSCFLDAAARNEENALKRGADGRPVFGVLCPGDGPRGQPGPPRCQMMSFFGQWPLLVWVSRDRPEEWAGLLEQASAFLARHVVTNTSRPSTN